MAKRVLMAAVTVLAFGVFGVSAAIASLSLVPPPPLPQIGIIDTLNSSTFDGGQCQTGFASGTGFGGTPQIVSEQLPMESGQQVGDRSIFFKNQWVRFVFRFDTRDNLYNQFEGWDVGNTEVSDGFLGPLYEDSSIPIHNGSRVKGDWSAPNDPFDASGPQPSQIFWHRTSRRSTQFADALGGGGLSGFAHQPWWYGNESTGTYQSTPTSDPCSDSSSNFGTLYSPYVEVGQDTVLNFDTIWQIEAVEPVEFDLMQVGIQDFGSLSQVKSFVTDAINAEMHAFAEAAPAKLPCVVIQEESAATVAASSTAKPPPPLCDSFLGGAQGAFQQQMTTAISYANNGVNDLQQALPMAQNLSSIGVEPKSDVSLIQNLIDQANNAVNVLEFVKANPQQFGPPDTSNAAKAADLIELIHAILDGLHIL